MADTHKVTKTKVVQLENGAYGVELNSMTGILILPRSEARSRPISSPEYRGEAIARNLK